MGGGLRGCRRRLCGAALSLRSFFCQPSATDQQSASQPCTDLIPLSLTLPLFLSPSISLSLSARGTCCPHVSFLRQPPVLLPTVHVCLATSLPAFLSASLHACLSLYLLFLQSSCLSAFVSVCMGACLSICLSACQPLFLANTSLAESGQAVSRSANLPDYLPVYSSSVCVFICLPARLSACLPVCLSICL